MSPAAGPLRAAKGGLILSVHVQPGAKREGAGPLHGGRLRLRVNAPPEGGRANARVVELVAELFELKRAEVELVSGETSRQKDLALSGLSLEDASRRMGRLLAAESAQ